MTSSVHRDLLNHLQEKVVRSLVDYVSVCEAVDLESTEIVASGTMAVIEVAASFLDSCGKRITPHSFADVCREVMRRHQEKQVRSSNGG